MKYFTLLSLIFLTVACGQSEDYYLDNLSTDDLQAIRAEDTRQCLSEQAAKFNQTRDSLLANFNSFNPGDTFSHELNFEDQGGGEDREIIILESNGNDIYAYINNDGSETVFHITREQTEKVFLALRERICEQKLEDSLTLSETTLNYNQLNIGKSGPEDGNYEHRYFTVARDLPLFFSHFLTVVTEYKDGEVHEKQIYQAWTKDSDTSIDLSEYEGLPLCRYRANARELDDFRCDNQNTFTESMITN